MWSLCWYFKLNDEIHRCTRKYFFSYLTFSNYSSMSSQLKQEMVIQLHHWKCSFLQRSISGVVYVAYLSFYTCLSVWSILAAKHQGQFFRCFTQFTIGLQAELMALDTLSVNYSDLIISAILPLLLHYYFQNNWKSSAHILETSVPAWNLVICKVFSAYEKLLQHISKLYT